MNKSSYFLAALALILIISFYFHSPLFSPLYNSDNAIHVLMAYYLDLPHDFYYWGQDRLGSLIPIVSHIFISILNLESIQVVSVVQYLFVGLIFITFSSLLTRTVSKISLAVILFLPLSCFPELIQIGHPYTPSLALIGLSVFILTKIDFSDSRSFLWERAIAFFFCGVTLFLSIWASEMAVVLVFPICLYTLVGLFFRQRKLSIAKDKEMISISGYFKLQLTWRAIFATLIFVLGCVASLMFISYAKRHAAQQPEYSTQWLSTSQEINLACAKYFSNFVGAITFNSGDYFLSLAVILFVVLLVGFFLAVDNQNKLSPWFYIFLIGSFLNFGLVITSKWVYLNGIASRYSASLYFILWLTVLLYSEKVDRKKNKFIAILILLISLLTGLSSFFRFIYPIHKIGTYQVYKNVKTLSPAGLVGNYWTAYLLGSVHPSGLVCAPNEGGGFMRSQALLDSVSMQKTIYLIKNNFLTEFPQSIKQYGFWFTKKGDHTFINNFELAPYTSSRALVDKSIPNKLIYSANSLTTQCGKTELEYDENGRSSYIIGDSTVGDCYLNIGPYIKLSSGKHKVHYTVKIDDQMPEGHIMTLDIYSEGKYLATRDLTKNDFVRANEYQVFAIDLDNKEVIKNLETRVRYLGKGKVGFKGIVIETLP